jgi:hypothetical protein
VLNEHLKKDIEIEKIKDVLGISIKLIVEGTPDPVE